MDELEKLESRLECIYSDLFDADDPCSLFVLSKDEAKELEKKAEQLKAKIDEIYKSMLGKLEKDNPKVSQSAEVRKLYDKSNKTNYIIFRFLIKHPEICSSSVITKEIEKYIYDCKEPGMSRKNYYKDVCERIDELDKLQPNFFHYNKFITFLNDICFSYLSDYFENEMVMKNLKFIEYLLEKVQDPHKNLSYGEYHSVKPTMEIALEEGLDLDLVYALGNEKKYKEYLNSHDKSFFINLINTIENEEIKKQLLVDIFEIKDTQYLHILIKFLAIPEIQKQLLDDNSFYYELLIDPLMKKRNHNFWQKTDENECNISQDFKCLDGEYASINEVMELHSEDFHDEKSDKIIHYFDKYVNNYIYFYYENEVKKVPVLYYIQTMRKKIKLWKDLNYFIDSVYIDDKLIDAFSESFREYFDKDFYELATEALIENMGRYLSREEEDYWDHLLNEANNYQEQEDESILLELKSTI